MFITNYSLLITFLFFVLLSPSHAQNDLLLGVKNNKYPMEGAATDVLLQDAAYRIGQDASFNKKKDPNGRPCPRGKYQQIGLTEVECAPCPRGRYGSTEGLTTFTCTAQCPAGRYNDAKGAVSSDDCRFCPPGKFGQSLGMTTRDCSGNCPTGKYSSLFGLKDDIQCVVCPPSYRSWQCKWDLIPRKGYFNSITGKIDENAHNYLNANPATTKLGQKTGATSFPDGEWSADRYAGDYSGVWYRGERAGAYPDNSMLYPGRPAAQNFNPAKNDLVGEPVQ